MENNTENNQAQNISASNFDIKGFLSFAAKQNFSDVHLRVDSPPVARKNGVIIKSNVPALTREDMDRVIEQIVPDNLKQRAHNSHDFDFSLEIKGVSRFRINLFHGLDNPGFVMRLIPFEVPPLESLHLPPTLRKFAEFNNGLVLVTGPTGSGKSTTLSSLLDFINTNFQKHVVTLEDPIEFIHTNKKCLFTQRQLGIDTDTFPNGMKYALRQDPDIILIGEMRDRETIMSALKAAETGHLVFSTLHTTDAVQTINRIINAFEPYERDAIRLQLSDTLRGTVAQKLVKRIDIAGRIPATEILMTTPAVRDYIAKDQIDNIYELLKTGNSSEMLSMDISLYRLVKAGLISRQAAIETSNNPNEMDQLLKGVISQGMVNYPE